MNKNVLKVNGCKKYCGYNIYAGSIDKYNYLIKYDKQFLVYNIYFNIDNIDINILKKEFKKINSNIIILFQNNTLNITGTLPNNNDIDKIINPILDKTKEILIKNDIKEVCKNCKKEKRTYLIDNDGQIDYFCNDCYKEFIKEAEFKEMNSKNVKQNLLLGILGSIIGTIPGILAWILLSYIGIEPGIAAIFISVGSGLGFKYFAKNMKLSGMIVSLMISIIAILFVHEFSWSIHIYLLYKDNYNINFIDAYQSIPYYLNIVKELNKQFYKELKTGYILSFIGIFSTYSLYRQCTLKYYIKKIGDKNE